MSLSPGARLGPYEILSPLGAGGMGEVYRARDTRLERTVAVKVLPQHMSSSPEVRQRFEREAKTISQLSHPHICTLYDVGREGETEYLVMELLEGDTLSERLAKGALPLEQTLRYGVEIADALDKAHRQGIVHRDLKPGNAMLTKSGVKLLDFGLAKAMAPAAPQSSLTALPTQQGLTQEGTILGTFQYMAPEQVEGKDADARTDIFAFGAVLYEMATGRKAFSGASQASLISAIMTAEPSPISAIQPMSPPALDRVVKICLAKDPEDRWQSVHDVGSELKWIAETSHAGVPVPVMARRGSRERLWMSAAVLSTLTALALGLLLVRSLPAPAHAVRAFIPPPENCTFTFVGIQAGPVAVSPDGRRLAFVAMNPEGKNLLFVRPLDAIAAQPLTGTEGASYPFWSPDSRYLGFFAEGSLKKVEASGGPAQTLCDAPDGRGGSWNRDGVILLTPTSGIDRIYRVSASGGTPVPVTELDTKRREDTHRWPFFLPDGRHFLFFIRAPKEAGIYVGSLDSKERTFLVLATSNAAYAPSSAGALEGYLLFLSGAALMAQPFDAKGLRLTAEAFPVAEQVASFLPTLSAVFSVSGTGVLAYQSGIAAGTSQLVWYERGGKRLATTGEAAAYANPRVSPDGRKLAFQTFDLRTGLPDIWTEDVSRGVPTRFTFGPSRNGYPTWSPDGSRIAFRSNTAGHYDLYEKPSSGTGQERLLIQSENDKIPDDWSLDGRFLAFDNVDAKIGSRSGLWILSLADGKASPFLQSEFSQSDGHFSPDGRWVAYTSNESGRNEVYVQPFPGRGGKWQISTAGGVQPRWRRNGKEIFYIAPDNKLMAVEISAGATFETAASKALFQTVPSRITGSYYDVSPDGQRFLVNTVTTAQTSAPITLVLNWTAGLAKK
jgi:Tol biopolymer transport system component